MTTEEARVRLRTKLESAFGAEEASILMDRPPGGWNDLVTNQVLEARRDALRYELVGQMAELRAQAAQFRAIDANPLMRFGMTMAEMLPVGVGRCTQEALHQKALDPWRGVSTWCSQQGCPARW